MTTVDFYRLPFTIGKTTKMMTDYDSDGNSSDSSYTKVDFYEGQLVILIPKSYPLTVLIMFVSQLSSQFCIFYNYSHNNLNSNCLLLLTTLELTISYYNGKNYSLIYLHFHYKVKTIETRFH